MKQIRRSHLHTMCREHKALSDVRGLLKEGKFKLDLWFGGSSSNSFDIKIATVNAQIAPNEKGSVEIVDMPNKLVNRLIEVANRSGSKMVKEAYEDDKQELKEYFSKYQVQNPEDAGFINDLINEYKLEV